MGKTERSNAIYGKLPNPAERLHATPTCNNFLVINMDVLFVVTTNTNMAREPCPHVRSSKRCLLPAFEEFESEELDEEQKKAPAAQFPALLRLLRGRIPQAL